MKMLSLSLPYAILIILLQLSIAHALTVPQSTVIQKSHRPKTVNQTTDISSVPNHQSSLHYQQQQEQTQEYNYETNKKRLPIVLVPGILGSQAYARPKCKTCELDSFESVWVNLKSFLNIRSMTEKLGLNYDKVNHRTVDLTNWEVKFPGFGDTWSVEYLDPKEKLFGAYLHNLVAHLEKDPFYITGVSLRGAPFDFRRGLNEMETFYTDLRKMIEETYSTNDRKRIVLVSHSLGAVVSSVFLKKQTDEWKRKYIHAWIPASGPFGGSVKPVKVFASGDNFGVFFCKALKARDMQRSPSLAAMFPDTRLWSKNETIVFTPLQNYTAWDMEQFFRNINFTNGYDMMTHSKRGHDFAIAPSGLDSIHCVYGSEVATISEIHYKEPTWYRNSFPDQNPTEITDDGDGTVNLRSLRLCQQWSGVINYELPGAEHTLLLSDRRFFDLIDRMSSI